MNPGLFRVGPYVATIVFFGGLAVRYALAHRRDRAAGFAEGQKLFIGGRLWRLGVLLLFVGHGAGLLFPQQILLWNTVPVRLYILEGLAFAAGIAALAGWAGVMWRHLGRAAGSAAGEVADAVFLSLLFVALLSGLLTAILYRWGSSWGVLTLTPYARSLASGNPAASLAADLPFLVRLHVFSSLAALAAIPFSRLAPLAMVPLHSALRLLGRPLSAVRRTLDLSFRKHNPLELLWPEED